MISREEIKANINTDYGISSESLKESRYGLCRYISDVCTSIEISSDIASIAMVYANNFFVKRCYFNYEKLIIACAAILLACKYESLQGKLTHICNAYSKYNFKFFGQVNNASKAEEEIAKIKDKITLAEITLLKCLDFEINVSLPNDFIYVYSAILYPENEEDILNYALRISNDSFYTYANLLFKNYVVAISSVILAAKFLSLPTAMDKNFKNIENMKMFSNPPAEEEEFNRRLLNYENKSFNTNNDSHIDNSHNYFDVLEWNHKLHPNLPMEELMECMRLIMEYYEDFMKADRTKTN